ncbi:hypothetical protein SPONL_1400 [uncultured Candidatus Thioglobus sp.]|nr:hypothetical protein SPONL_1400 [uncultured Candidatus Thioglobus sp.]
MIERYADHAANERTYLAWIRTAISIMIFGFFIERVDLFLAISINPATGELFGTSTLVEIIGLIVFFTGSLITLLSTVRFFRYKKNIMSEECILYDVKNSNIFLSSIIVFISFILLFYMVYEFEIDVHLGLR